MTLNTLPNLSFKQLDILTKILRGDFVPATEYDTVNHLKNRSAIINVKLNEASNTSEAYYTATVVEFKLKNPEIIDPDGLYIYDGVDEIHQSELGCIEAIIQRPNTRVVRYFKSNSLPHLGNMYRQLQDKHYVVMASII